jgi:hypothetical protein
MRTGPAASSTPPYCSGAVSERAGQLSIKELARQHKLSDTAIHKRAKAKGWTRDLSGAVRTRVREGLVCEVRANLIAGGKPSDAAIIDEAAAIGVAVVGSHRRDIDALRQVTPSRSPARSCTWRRFGSGWRAARWRIWRHSSNVTYGALDAREAPDLGGAPRCVSGLVLGGVQR